MLVMITGTQTTKEDLKQELLDLIRVAGALDSSRRWLELNRLWLETEHRKRSTELITGYLSLIKDWSAGTVLLYLDGITSSYGVLPLLGNVTSTLGCKLAIWRELGQVVLAEPWLLPSIVPTGLSCVVFQDVVGRGTTLLKAIDDLTRVNWSVTDFVCLVNKTADARDAWETSLAIFQRSKICVPEFEFHSLLDVKDHFKAH
jgi:hypothetical protein